MQNGVGEGSKPKINFLSRMLSLFDILHKVPLGALLVVRFRSALRPHTPLRLNGQIWVRVTPGMVDWDGKVR